MVHSWYSFHVCIPCFTYSHLAFSVRGAQNSIGRKVYNIQLTSGKILQSFFLIFFYFQINARGKIYIKIFYILSKCTCICGSSDSMYKITHNVSECMYDISVYILSKKCIRYSSRRCMLDILYWYRSRPSVFFEGMGGIPR